MTHDTRIIKRLFFLVVIAQVFLSGSLWACTRAMWVNNYATVVGRTMDWNGDMKSNLFVFPRGIARDGLADVNSMQWVSKYGSISTFAYDAFATDGVNEKGLGVHIHWLLESDYGTRNPELPGMSVLMVEQYLLDNFASVDEVVRFFNSTAFQIEPFELAVPMTLQYLVEDASGDSAIIEYLDGKPHVFHDRSYTVVANTPSYDKHLTNLRLYKGFGGDKSLPGTTESLDRFVRASYYVNHLPEPTSIRDAITKILSVIGNTAMPYGTSSPERPTPSETIWYTAIDLTHRTYYFVSTTQYELMWASLDEFNLNAGAPALKLDVVNNPQLTGNVAYAFKPEPVPLIANAKLPRK